MSRHAALQLQPWACWRRGSGDHLHDKDWRQQFKGSAIINTLSGYQPQVPTLCVSEHAWHANALLQVEEYTGGSAAITLCQLALGARHQASSWLNPPIRRDLKGQYAVSSLPDVRWLKKQKQKKHWYVKLQWCYTSQSRPFEIEPFLLSCLLSWTGCACVLVHVNHRLPPPAETVAPAPRYIAKTNHPFGGQSTVTSENGCKKNANVS